MSHVLVLLASDTNPISPDKVGEIIAPIPQQHRSPVRWLDHARACEVDVFPFDGNGSAAVWDDENDMLSTIERTVAAPHASNLDIALVPAANRKKKLLLSDMDSTMIQQECIDELADFAGFKDKVAKITQRAMDGELDFADALTERVGLLKDLPVSTLQDVVDTRLQLMPGARTLIQTMNANGATCVLVSGGFTFFTEAIAQKVGFSSNHANILEITDGKLSGRVVPPILGAQAKLEALHRYLNENSLSPEDALAVGDGANDLPMIDAAGLGVAFRAHPVLVSRADAAIRHTDLTALLHLQGYTRDEFVE